jgi:hypothetical protein
MPTVGSCPNCLADLVGRHQRACLTCGEEIPLEVRLIEIPVEPPVAVPALELVAEPAPAAEPEPLDAEPVLPQPEPEAAPGREMDWEDEQPESPAPSRKRRFFRR